MKTLIHEIHRRSLWQVLGIYLAVSWVAIQVVETLTQSAGLPDWVPPGAIVLLVIGLPIVMATAFVQEGVRGKGEAPDGAGASEAGLAGPTGTAPDTRPATHERGATDASGNELPATEATAGDLSAGTGSLDRPSTRPSRFARLFTWRNAIAGGVLAFAGLGALVTSYWFMWATGVGPVGSLVAQGVIEEADVIILADFENATDDPLMGDLVTSTLRIDLVESPMITVAEPLFLEQVLQRMGRDPGEPITPAVAREIAVREGLKAVIEGEVRTAGSEFLLSATIRSADDGRSLAAFRVVAEDEGEVVEALDELSQDIRERAGESLKSIRADAPLESVTTSSLDALRKFTEAERLTEEGDEMAALTLLDDAVELDAEFAMAYRKIAVLYANTGLDPVRMIEAATKAYELGARLADRERYLAEANYHVVVTGDREAAIQAYRTVLRSHPDDQSALNNLANQYIGFDDEAALELYRRANSGPGESNTSNANLVITLLRLGRFGEAEEALVRYESRYPLDLAAQVQRYWLHFFRGEFEAADSVALDLARNPRASAQSRQAGHSNLGATDLFHGRIEAAAAHHGDAQRAAAEAGPTAEYYEAWLMPVTELMLDLDSGAGLRMLDDLGDLFEQVPPVARPYLVLGALAATAGEPERARRYLDDWEANVPVDYRSDDDEANRIVAEGLIDWRTGDPARGLELVDQGRQDLNCNFCWLFIRALVVEDAGTPDEALAAWEEFANTIQGFYYINARGWPLAWERLCHLHAEHGEATSAAQYCSRFVDVWADADPRLQPRVRSAQQRLDALTGS